MRFACRLLWRGLVYRREPKCSCKATTLVYVVSGAAPGLFEKRTVYPQIQLFLRTMAGIALLKTAAFVYMGWYDQYQTPLIRPVGAVLYTLVPARKLLVARQMTAQLMFAVLVEPQTMWLPETERHPQTEVSRLIPGWLILRVEVIRRKLAEYGCAN